jgi:hypothetical protein
VLSIDRIARYNKKLRKKEKRDYEEEREKNML